MSGRNSLKETTNRKRFGGKVGGYKVTLCEEAGTEKNGTQGNGTKGNGTKGNGYERNGYERNGYEKNGYEKNGYEKNGYEKYFCPLCGFVLRNPVQTMRGQLACYSCYDNALR